MLRAAASTLRRLPAPWVRGGVRLCSSEAVNTHTCIFRNPVGEIPTEEEIVETATRDNNRQSNPAARCFGTNFFSDLTLEEFGNYQGEEPDTDDEFEFE